MKHTILRHSVLRVFFLFLTTLQFAQSNNDIIKEAQKLFEENYIFLDKAKETNAHLDALMKKDFFDEMSPIDFAKAVTIELQKVTKDKHLRFLASRNRSVSSVENSFTRILSRYRSPMLRGFQLFESNIGYVDLAFFGGSQEHFAKIDQVMNDMLTADAIIFDMRRNGGGSPRTVNYLCSYFFDENKLLNTIYSRFDDHTLEFSVVDVAGVKRPKVPVLILTSKATFSGAEDFSYTMQNWGRATVIGEVTGGGAHPTRYFPLSKGFGIDIPFAMSIHPITKTNWEGVGVQPDIKMPADNALEKAKELALTKAKTYKNLLFKPLREELAVIESKKSTNFDRTNLYKQLEILVQSKVLGERSINNLGYSYLQNNEPEVALAIFESNTVIFSDSANTWDSLAECYLRLDKKEKAIEYYQKTIKMDPDGVGENARTMIKKIKTM